jgi:hypothetical protein
MIAKFQTPEMRESSGEMGEKSIWGRRGDRGIGGVRRSWRVVEGRKVKIAGGGDNIL